MAMKREMLVLADLVIVVLLNCKAEKPSRNLNNEPQSNTSSFIDIII